MSQSKWIDELSLGDVRDAVHQGLMRVLGAYGFVHDTTGEHQLMLRFPGGFHRITIPIFDEKPAYSFRFLLATRLDQVAAVAAVFAGTDVAQHLCSLVDYGYFYGQPGKEYAIDSRPGLALAVTEMNIALVNKLLPLLEHISDVAGLEALYNAPVADTPFQLSKDEGYTALTLARLAGNPGFGAMCLATLAASQPDARRKLQRLIAFLEHDAASTPPQAHKTRFLEDYDGSQQADIEVASNGATGADFYDAHAGFRLELMREAGPALAGFSLRLLRDIFAAHAKACGAAQRFDAPELATLTCALLTRGGVGELTLFTQAMPERALSARAMLGMPLAASMAASLRHACDERTSNPMFSERAPQYEALKGFFGALAARGN